MRRRIVARARFLWLGLALLASVSPTVLVAQSVCNQPFVTTPAEAGIPSYDSATPDARSPQSVIEPVNNSYAQLPLSFEANQGQTDARVRFLSRNNGYNLFLTADEAVLSLEGRDIHDQTTSPANFTGTRLTYSISGRVTEGAVGLGGVAIALSGAASANTVTDASGNYSFTGVQAGFNYSVAASAQYYAMTPAVWNFVSLNGNQTANFAATRLTYQVSGVVQDSCARAIASVTMTLTHNGIPATATTNSSGQYSFSGVPAGYNYSLVPTKTGYTFNPVSVAFTNLTANQSANFTGTPVTVSTDVAPTADAYVRGGSSASSNFGTATQLITRLASSATNTYETYLTFNVGQPCTVASVKLKLFGNLSGTPNNVQVSAYAVANTTWTETGLTWNNKPAAGALLKTTTVVNTTAAWYEWDITTYVRSEIAAGRSIISIALKNPATTSNQATFNSRQATTNQPKLVVVTP